MKSLKIVQINMNKQVIVAEQLRDYVRKEKCDVMLIQDPPTTGREITGFDHRPYRTIAYDGENAGAAIVICTPALSVMSVPAHTTQYVATARVHWGLKPTEYVTMVSAYCKYAIPTVYFTTKLTGILEDERSVIAGVDTNGHSTKWHCPDTNKRGRMFEELIEDHKLKVHNRQGQIDTYCRKDMGSSNIDVTMTSTTSEGRIKGWRVADETDSDHRIIAYDYNINKEIKFKDQQKGRLNDQKADWPKFIMTLRMLINKVDLEGDIDVVAKNLTEAITLSVS